MAALVVILLTVVTELRPDDESAYTPRRRHLAMHDDDTTEALSPGNDPPTGPTRRLTIEDVATAAGVSVATVSRALRGLPNVTPSTRQHVQDVADRLDYLPDPAAARLAAGRTGTVTVAVPSLNGWYFSTVVAGAEAVCADAGLEFQVVAVASPAQRNRLLDESRRLERRTDGLILVDITIEPHQVESLEQRRIGLATIGSNVPATRRCASTTNWSAKWPRST